MQIKLSSECQTNQIVAFGVIAQIGVGPRISG